MQECYSFVADYSVLREQPVTHRLEDMIMRVAANEEIGVGKVEPIITDNQGLLHCRSRNL